ncbi:MAG: response regulator [Pseudomonadota bacterium]
MNVIPAPCDDLAARILVVDDQEDNRNILLRRLSRLQYLVDTATDGVDALRRVERDPPDLLLLDYMMPGLSGLEVLVQLREKFDASSLPIIMITARADDETVVACLEAGANDYVSKPLSFPILRARVESQLERRRASLALGKLNQHLENRIEQRTRELTAHNDALKKAHEQLAESDRAKTLFLATLSHELRTPLNSIIGLTELMFHEALGPLQPVGYKDYVANIRESSAYLHDLVTAVLDAASLEQGNAVHKMAPFDLVGAVDEAIRVIEFSTPDAPSRISAHLAEHPVVILGDRRRIQQAVTNILANAVKFSPEDQMVDVSLEDTATFVKIQIDDNGCGVPEDKIPSLIVPFIQIYNSGSVKQQGAGLGLTIANEITRAHRGRLVVSNRSKGGLSVQIILPKAQPDGRSPVSAADSEPQASP